MGYADQFSILKDEIEAVIVPQAVYFLVSFSPIFLAIVLALILWPLWLAYVRAKYNLSLKKVVLEVRLPKDTYKSPQAMESVLHSVHNTADGNWFKQYWKGEYRPYYSLEIVSVEGQVKFYIWCEDQRKNGFMTALYAQYPGIEIIEREDYTRSMHFDPATMKLWAAEFKFTKDDPYPIKTYVDYGLDKDPKEEFKVDPMLPLIEWLGSVGPNQQVWFQFMIQAHYNNERKPGHLFMKTDLWKDKADELKNKIMLRDPTSKAPMLSEGERNVILALERATSKLAFNVGIRAIYIAKKDVFNTPFGIGGIIGNMKQFNSEGLNGFKPNGDKWIAQFEYPWQDYKDIRRNMLSKRAIKAYKRRSYFYPPYQGKPLVMNTEELATIYHFPGSVSATPTLDRIPSKKGEAPANLPV